MEKMKVKVLNLNLKNEPFSRYGSYMAFVHRDDPDVGPSGIYMKSVHDAPSSEPPNVFETPNVFHLEPIRNGRPISYQEEATPSILSLKSVDGKVDICLPTMDTARVRGSEVGLKIRVTPGQDTMYNTVLKRGKKRWQINVWSHKTQYGLEILRGNCEFKLNWDGTRCRDPVAEITPEEDNKGFELAIQEFRGEWIGKYGESFEKCVEKVGKEFRNWLEEMPEVPDIFSRGRTLAAYVIWSSVVKPRDNYLRPAVLMSKNRMNKVWSWDHCFNAMNLICNQPILAWHQFMLPFDYQESNGVLPDLVSDTSLQYNFTKPPIHGWALRWMYMRSNHIDQGKMEEIYNPLCLWTNWWMNFRDDDKDGIPQYNHGNDSGEDNSSWFSKGVPVESPDLSAYLVLQMDVLSEVAERLGKKRESMLWKSRSDELLERLVDHFWSEKRNQFIAVRSGSHSTVENSDGLLVYMPIVLGDKLPDDLMDKLVRGVKERFLTEYGLATENPKSPYYESDGYWRGPIWAPSTMIIVDGLAQAGRGDLSGEISRRFCSMVNDSGMAENFDALSGEGYRDRALTWTPSIFSILAHEYVQLGR